MIDPLGIKKNDPLGLKKKVDSKPRSQEELWGSDSQPQDLYTSLATGAQEPQQESDGLGGPPSPPVKKKPSVLFPETPMGRPASSVMYETKQPVLVESTPLETKPNKYYRMVSDEKKAVEQQLSDLEERNTRLGRRPEDLTTEGTYQALQKQKAQLDQEFEPAQTAIKQIQRQAGGLLDPSLERLVYGATDGKYSYFTTDIINLNKDVEDKIIDRFDDAPEETKVKWYKGALPVEAKEAIINSAKTEVINDKYNILKNDADNYIKNIKDNPAIPLEEKLKFQKDFKDSSDAFNSQLALDYSEKLLKNNFKITDINRDIDEAIPNSKYEGFIPDTLDLISTFAEGTVQVGAKARTGIPSLVLMVAEKFNQLTGISRPEDYTPIEATMDLINDTTNLNFLPSSQTERGNIVVDGEFNPSYYSAGKTIAKTLPFTLKIMSDVKKGRIEGTPQSMISQLINPKYSKDFADKLRVVETAYKVTIADSYREAKEIGMDDSKAFLYANVMALAEGVSENIMPDYKYLDSLTGASLKSLFKGNLKQAVTKQATKNVTKDFFKGMALELGEEEVILATEDALKYSLLLNHKNSEFFNMSRQKELVATTALLSGALGTVSVNQKFKQNKKDLYNSIHSNIYDLQDAFLDEIDSPLNDQKAKEALITAYKFANDVSVAVSNAPENVTADQIDLLVQKKNLEEKKKTIDTAFHPDINEEITAIDTKIRELAKMPVVEAPAVEEVAVEEPAVEEVKPTEIKPSGQKVTDVINRPATLESQAGVKLETPIDGDVYQEGQRVIFEDKNKKIYDLGNIDEISDKTVEELGIKPQEEMVSVTPEGKVKVGENEWNMQSELPNYGIEYDNDGNVKAVSLKDDAGKTVMYEGQVAEDAAYQVLLKQTETPEQRQAINEILENDEELNRQLREAEEATQAAAVEVTEPGTKKAEGPEELARIYKERITNIKESDPEQYWSVDIPSDEVILDAAKNGRLVDKQGGMGIVTEDGNMVGMFKYDKSAKGTAQAVQGERVKIGGKKLDNFDGYLTKLYEKNGFRVVSRVPFNEEYAPEGWNKEKHGTPDVVAMVYDPEGKLDIEEKTFDDYDEAMAYRDSFLEPSIDTELEGLAKLFDESDKGFRMSQVDNAKEALKGILPGVEFIVHETNEAYKNATGESGSGGMYIYSAGGDKVIHINKQKANGRTVAHEVFHAVILDKIKGDKAVQEITARMVDAVYKTASPELRAELDAFAARYTDKTIRDEERLAELIGIIADGYPKMSPANKSIVKRWLDALAKTFGLKPFTDNEVIDLLNTLAGKISTGEVISAEDVAIFKAKEKGIINKIRRQLSEDESTNIAKEVVSKTVKGKSIPTWIQKKTKAKEKFVSFSGEINQENVKINAPASYNTVASKLSNYNTFNIDVKQELKDNLIGAEKADINKILENNKKKLESKIKSLSKEVDKVKKKKVSEDFSKEEKLATIQSLQDSIKYIKDIVKTKDLNDQLNMVLDIKSKTIKDSLYKDLFYGLGKNAKKLTDKELIAKSEAIYNKSKDIVKANLLSVYNSVSPTIRKISKLWYDGANLIAQDMSKKYGVTNEQSAAIIATQSPQMPWFDNLHLADVIMDLMSSKKDDIFTKELFNYYVSKSKKYAAQVSYIPTLKESVGKKLSELSDKDAAIFIRSYYDTKLSRKAPIRIPTGTSIDIDQTGDSSFSGYDVIAKGVSIFRNGSIENISNQLGEANKVRNFYMNIADPSDKRAVTIDTHAMAIALFKPLASNDYEVNFDPATFAFYADAYRELAVELGIEARALQSITWEAARAIFPAEKKAKPGYKAKISGLWDKLSKGEQTIKGIQEDIYKEANDPNITEWSEYINVLKDEKARKNVSGRIVELEGAKDSSKLGDVSGDNIGVSRDGRGITVPGKGTEIKRSQEVTKKLQQTNDINEIVRIAKEAKYSDAAISAFLKDKGFSDAEITSALSTDRPSVNKIYEDSKKAIDDKKKRVSIKDLAPFLRKSLLDRQAYIKRVINRIDNKSAKKAYDLLVTKAGASALASERFKRAEKKIYGGLSSEDVSTLDKIIYAKRMVAVNESRAKLGLEPYKGMDGYSIDDANRDLADFKNSLGDKKFNDLSNRATEYFDVFKLNLKKLYESGRISEETYESLKDTEYSPIKTIKYIIGDNLSVDEIDTQAKSLGISRNDIMKLSDNNENEIILDSKWLLAMSINSVEGRAFENNMLREFDKAIKEATPEEKKAFEDIILDNPVVGTKKDGGLKYKYDDTRLPVGYTKVSYFNDSNKVEIVLKDQYAKQLLDVKNKNKALETLGKLTGTKILRFFATGGNPLFIIGNTAVDFQNIAFFSDVYSKFKPMATAQLARDYTKNFVKKLFVSNEYNKVFNEYINHGGALDYMASDGLRSLESMNPVKGVTKAVQKGLVAYGRAMSLLGETSEVAFRLSVFQKVKEDSIKEFKKENNREPNAQELDDIMWNAGRQSRETMDFSQGGDVAKNIDAVFPYFNAALQGIRRPIDFAKKDPVGFSSSVLQYTVMASSLAAGSFAMLINAVGGDDDEDRAKKIMDAMNSLSEYEKANYHIMFTGEKNKDGEYEYYRVKKLPVLSVISTVAEQLIYKEFFNSKGIDYDMDSKVMLEAVNKSNPLPVTVQEVAGKNPVASGLVSYWANKDTFTGDKIFREPDNKKILPEAEGMFDDRVDQIYKDLAPGFGLSPARTKVMVEKVITSANTNPTIPLIYSAYDGLFNKSDGLGSEVKEAMSGVGDAFGKKVVRYTDKKIIRYKDQDEREYQESVIETKVWNSEQKVYNEIKKKYDGGGNLTNKELIDLVKENFEPMDYMKYAKKYNTYIHNMNIDKSVLDIIFEDVPEVQAMKLNQRYGPNLEGEELKELGKAMNSAGKRINNKSIYIYNKKYKNRNKAQ